MKRFLIAYTIANAIALLLLSQSSPPNTSEHKTDTKHSNTGKENGKNSFSETTSGIGEPERRTESNCCQYQTKQNAKSRLFTPEWVTAFATVVYVLIASLTLWAIRNQATLMRKGLVQNRKSAARQFNLMNNQWKAMKDQVAHMGDTLTATRKAADAAVLSAETAKRALELLERADVLIEDIKFDTVQTTEWGRIRITLKNYGRSRADNITIAAKLIATYDELELYTPVMTTAIPPNCSADVASRYLMGEGAEWLGGEREQKMRRGDEALLVEFRIGYTDRFTNSHVVEGTATYQPFNNRILFAISYSKI